MAVWPAAVCFLVGEAGPLPWDGDSPKAPAVQLCPSSPLPGAGGGPQEVPEVLNEAIMDSWGSHLRLRLLHHWSPPLDLNCLPRALVNSRRDTQKC